MAYQLKSQSGRNVVRMRGAHLQGMGDAYDDYYLWYANQSQMDPGSYPYGGAMDRNTFTIRYNAGMINAQGIPISPDSPAPDVPTGGKVPSGSPTPAPGGGGGGNVAQQVIAGFKNIFGGGAAAPNQPPQLIFGMPMPVVLVGGAIVALAAYKHFAKKGRR